MIVSLDGQQHPGRFTAGVPVKINVCRITTEFSGGTAIDQGLRTVIHVKRAKRFDPIG